jgi:hypothetical protein
METAFGPLLNVNEMNMRNTIEHSVEVKESEIRVAAYQLWEKTGRPSGQDLQFWLDAEKQLRTGAKAASARPVASSSTVASGSSAVGKAASVRLGPSRPNSPKAQRKVRRF